MHHTGDIKNEQNLVESWLDIFIDKCNTHRRGQVPWKQNELVPWTFRGLFGTVIVYLRPKSPKWKCREKLLPNELFPGLPSHPALCALFGLALWSQSAPSPLGYGNQPQLLRVLSKVSKVGRSDNLVLSPSVLFCLYGLMVSSSGCEEPYTWTHSCESNPLL